MNKRILVIGGGSLSGIGLNAICQTIPFAQVSSIEEVQSLNQKEMMTKSFEITNDQLYIAEPYMPKLRTKDRKQNNAKRPKPRRKKK